MAMRKALLWFLAPLLLSGAVAVASNYGGSIAYDSPAGISSTLTTDLNINGNSLQCSGETSDVAPDSPGLYGCSAWAGAVSNTAGGSTHVSPGIGSRRFAIVNYSVCATDTATVTIDGTANALVEGTAWNRGASNTAACSALATAIDALSGVGAECVGTEVHVSKEGTTHMFSIAFSDTNCATATSGADGVVRLWGNAKLGLNQRIVIDDDDDSYIMCSSDDACGIYVSGSLRFQVNTSYFGGSTPVLANRLYHTTVATELGQTNCTETVTGVGAGDILLCNQFEVQGEMTFTGKTLASLGTPDNGTLSYCSDCTRGSAPCTGSGSGAFAKREGGAWNCD